MSEKTERWAWQRIRELEDELRRRDNLLYKRDRRVRDLIQSRDWWRGRAEEWRLEWRAAKKTTRKGS